MNINNVNNIIFLFINIHIKILYCILMNKELVLVIFIIIFIVLIFCINCIKKKCANTNKNIDKIYVINLEKNKDRLKKFMKCAKKANVNVKRFDAVNGKELSKNDPYVIKYFGKNSNLNPGQIGCALSHIKIWEDAIKNNYNNIIVFEDDAIIPKDFWYRFNKAYYELPKNWEMLLLGGVKLGGKIYSNNLLKPDNRSGNWGLSSLLLNINFMKKIIKEIKLNITIDDYLINNYYYKKNNNIFIVSKTIVEIDYSFNSDIGYGVVKKNYKIVIYKESEKLFSNNISKLSSFNVSLCIPCIPRDKEKLVRLMESVNNQELKPMEIVISLSGETFKNNNFKNRLEKIAKVPIKIIYSKKNKIASENRNIASENASGDILSYIDADDIMKKNRIKRIVDIFKKFNCNAVLHSFEYTLDTTINTINKINIYKGKFMYELSKKVDTIHLWINNENAIHHGHLSIKKSVFKDIKFNTSKKYRRSEDSKFVRDIIEYYGNDDRTICFTNEKLSYYIPASSQK